MISYTLFMKGGGILKFKAEGYQKKDSSFGNVFNFYDKDGRPVANVLETSIEKIIIK